MKSYQTKTSKLTGTNFRQVHQKVLHIYDAIKKRTKRRVYIRSAYFRKGKVFLGLFWEHLYEKKHYKDQVRRMKYFPCAIELIRHSKIHPESKENPNRREEILHRFAGVTKDGDIFFVQVKENKRNNQKYFMSVFPLGKE